jgi:hypothetical protein
MKFPIGDFRLTILAPQWVNVLRVISFASHRTLAQDDNCTVIDE